MIELSTPQPRRSIDGMTLMEIILAMVISATIAVAALTFVRGNGQNATDRACQSARAALQSDVRLYEMENGVAPSSGMSELVRNNEVPAAALQCPQSGNAMTLRGGIVTCPQHGDL